MKKLVISTLFVMQVFFVFAQNISGISGKVVDAKTQKPLQNAIASIQNSNLTQLTNAEGKFIFETVAVGKWRPSPSTVRWSHARPAAIMVCICSAVIWFGA